MGYLAGFVGNSPGVIDALCAALHSRGSLGNDQISVRLGQHKQLSVARGKSKWTDESGFVIAGEQFLVISGILHKNEKVAFTAGIDLLHYLCQDPANRLPLLDASAVLALFDGEKLWLWRDAGGVRSLYYAVLPNGGLIFASKAQALFVSPDLRPQLRPAAVSEYFTFSYIPGEETMFESVKMLTPGTWLCYENEHIRVKRWFTFEELEYVADDYDRNYWLAKNRQALEESVKACCDLPNGIVPGVFISGGIDSSTILAMATNYLKQRLHSFSVDFGPEYPSENEYIALVTKQYQAQHHYLTITAADYAQGLLPCARMLDEPLGDKLTVPNYLLAAFAANYSSVILNGEGGDPCYGGPKNIPMLLAQLYGPVQQLQAGEISDKIADDYGIYWLTDYYLTVHKMCYSILHELLAPDFWAATGGRAALYKTMAPYLNAPPQKYLNRLMQINIRIKGGNLICPKAEKHSAHFGVLALAPFLSGRTIAAAFGAPTAMKLVGNMEKGILKQITTDLLPDRIIHRPKTGMMTPPVNFWLRGAVRAYLATRVTDKSFEELGIFNVPYVQKLVKDHLYNDYDYEGRKVWMVMAFILWYDIHILGKIPF